MPPAPLRENSLAGQAEQREGRVDRYGQSRKVRALTYYGTDNAIDGVVLEVLLRKHRKIRGSLGISVPVPVDTERVMSAILHTALLRKDSGQLRLDLAQEDRLEVEIEWDAAAMKVTNSAAAQELVSKAYRRGFELTKV